MRSPRIVGVGTTYHHCISRVVDRRIIFHAPEKEAFRSILRKLETFTGVRVATYCLMGNHFHLLLEVPDRSLLPELDAEELLAVLPLLYDKATIETIAHEITAARKAGDTLRENAILQRFERRRGNLSIFLKELKQRVSIFMNKRLGRTGTLWEGRFKSLLVEGGESALLTVAAYIDLNPIRAKLVFKPEDYRWSGYGEANGAGKGAARARQGLGSIQREALENPGTFFDWKRTLDRYRVLLYMTGQEHPSDERHHPPSRPGISPAEVSKATEQTTILLPELLRRKVRYFSDGAVLGSAAFVERSFEYLREKGRIGPKRRTGARTPSGGDWGELRVLRDLRVRVYGPPPT